MSHEPSYEFLQIPALLPRYPAAPTRPHSCSDAHLFLATVLRQYHVTRASTVNLILRSVKIHVVVVRIFPLNFHCFKMYATSSEKRVSQINNCCFSDVY